jgi:hypothetical protein
MRIITSECQDSSNENDLYVLKAADIGSPSKRIKTEYANPAVNIEDYNSRDESNRGKDFPEAIGLRELQNASSITESKYSDETSDINAAIEEPGWRHWACMLPAPKTASNIQHFDSTRCTFEIVDEGIELILSPYVQAEPINDEKTINSKSLQEREAEEDQNETKVSYEKCFEDTDVSLSFQNVEILCKEIDQVEQPISVNEKTFERQLHLQQADSAYIEENLELPTDAFHILESGFIDGRSTDQPTIGEKANGLSFEQWLRIQIIYRQSSWNSEAEHKLQTALSWELKQQQNNNNKFSGLEELEKITMEIDESLTKCISSFPKDTCLSRGTHDVMDFEDNLNFVFADGDISSSYSEIHMIEALETSIKEELIAFESQIGLLKMPSDESISESACNDNNSTHQDDNSTHQDGPLRKLSNANRPSRFGVERVLSNETGIRFYDI